MAAERPQIFSRLWESRRFWAEHFRPKKTDLGLRSGNTSVMRLSLPDSKYHEHTQVAVFLKNLRDRLQALPGILNAGMVSCPLVSVPGFCPDTVFEIEGHPSSSGHLTDAEYRQVSPEFFRAAGIPLSEGRTFTDRDEIGLDDKHPHSGQVIVNRAFARRFFPTENALGKHVELHWFVGNNAQPTSLKYEVISVAGDALERPDAAAEPIFYLPIFAGDSTDISIVLHMANAATGVSAQAESIIHQLDPDLAVFGVQTVSQLVNDTIRSRKYMTLLFGVFAMLAIVLATVGLYGVVSWGVLQRRNETALRMAVGASATEVLKMIVLRGLRPTILGVMAGIPCALITLRVLRSLLFQVRPTDPFTFVVVPLLLVVVALLASFLPAIRAARIDPMMGLRVE